MVATGRKKPNKTEELTQRLEQRVEWLESLIANALGITGQWMSPDRAGKLIAISGDRIKSEIRKAESARSLSLTPCLKYGVHYRNIQDEGSATPTWQVNLKEIEQHFNTPPDQR